MRRQTLDVEEVEAVAGERAASGGEREVAKVLVVDRVELSAVDERHEVRKLDRDDALGREQRLHARDKRVEVRRVRENVVAEQQVCLEPIVHHPPRLVGAEEGDARRDATRAGDRRDVGRGLDAEARDPLRDDVLQEVAVVGGDLDDVALRPEPEALRHVVHVAPRVLDPRVRVGREVGVVREDVVRQHVVVDLDERAGVADEGVERIERLGGPGPAGRWTGTAGSARGPRPSARSGAPHARHASAGSVRIGGSDTASRTCIVSAVGQGGNLRHVSASIGPSKITPRQTTAPAAARRSGPIVPASSISVRRAMRE